MISAVIFDLDGTVLDNEHIWEEVFAQVVNSYHLETNKLLRQPNGWLHEPGIGLVPNFRQLEPDIQKAEKLARETRQLYKQRIGEVKLAKGVEETAALAKRLGWLTALSTASIWETVEEELEATEMYLAFDVTTTGEEIIANKPDPEIYLLTAYKLGVDPAECIVIEDALAGVRAGKEAGMTCIGLVSGYAPEKMLTGAGAGWAVQDMRQAAGVLSDLSRVGRTST